MDPRAAASSPGELLIIEIARDAIARGFSAFDLGVGEARYKSECCETTEVLFDGALAISTIGRLGALGFFAARRIKRWIKRFPALHRLAVRARALAARGPG
jgi:CelD/BcsL family acetyltransferase involved in cellulose biosynthesis